jgi:sporulation protein YlmC with PRC-barrel domain
MPFRVALPTALITVMALTAAEAQEPAIRSPSEKAQTTTERVTGGVPILTSIPSAMTTIANYYKQTVYDPTDKKIGEIHDVLVDKDGKIEVLIISVGRISWTCVKRRCCALQGDSTDAKERNLVFDDERDHGRAEERSRL